MLFLNCRQNKVVNAIFTIALKGLVDSKSSIIQAHVVPSVWQQKVDVSSYYRCPKRTHKYCIIKYHNMPQFNISWQCPGWLKILLHFSLLTERKVCQAFGSAAQFPAHWPLNVSSEFWWFFIYNLFLAHKMLIVSVCLFCFSEQLSCEQQGTFTGPQIYSGPPDQHHLLQNEGEEWKEKKNRTSFWFLSLLSFIYNLYHLTLDRSRNCKVPREPVRLCETVSKPASTPRTTTSSTTVKSCTVANILKLEIRLDSHSSTIHHLCILSRFKAEVCHFSAAIITKQCCC